MRKLYTLLFSSLVLGLSSCDSGTAPEKRGAIVFGDSSLIVTENDPQFLSDNVTDFVPQKFVEKDTLVAVAPPKKDSVPAVVKPQVVAAESPKAKNGKGLEVPFKALNIFIPNIQARLGKNIDWNNAKGASYTLDEGELNNNALMIKDATVTKIMQRYQTVVLLKSAEGKFEKLSSLPVSTSEWQTVNGSNGKFSISGLGNAQLKYNNKLSPNALRNAGQKMARANRMNKKEEEQLLKSLRNVRTPNQAPLSIALQSIVWKISAKDANGKAIERELRIDINR